MSDTVLVAVIGAFATVMTALFQIFVSSRQAASAVKPMRNRIKSLAWTVVLLVAAAGGGFAWSEYLVLTRDARLAALHERIAAVTASGPGAAAPVSPVAAPAPAAAPMPRAAEATPRETATQAAIPLTACPPGEPGCTQAAIAPVSPCAPLPTGAPAAEAPAMPDTNQALPAAKPAG